MKKIEQTKKSELATYEAKTKYFLDYVFDTYGANFLGMKTYNMSEILECKDRAITRYFDFVSNLLSSIPYRFQILHEKMDERHYKTWVDKEFIAFKNDVVNKLVAKGFR